jgi:Rieske 2Fe-2S family protein
MSAAERASYARYQQARSETEEVWRRAGLPSQRIESLHGRPTAFRTERLVLDGAGESMTADTRVASKRLLGSLTEPRLGTLHYHTQPNAWFHFLSDHILTFSTLPIDCTHTLVRSTWLVHAEAEEGRDYDLAKLTSVWNATNSQDAHFVAETQRGASSPAYLPGPIAPSEYMVEMFHTWYEERLRAGLGI